VVQLPTHPVPSEEFSVTTNTILGLPSGTVLTLVGGAVALLLGFIDLKTGTSLGRDADTILIGAGLGAFLGANPLTAVAVK